jgi:hypothetical protein
MKSARESKRDFDEGRNYVLGYKAIFWPLKQHPWPSRIGEPCRNEVRSYVEAPCLLHTQCPNPLYRNGKHKYTDDIGLV